MDRRAWPEIKPQLVSVRKDVSYRTRSAIRDVEVAVPDLAGWRRERMPNVPDDQRFDIAPRLGV
ncbi:MAG: hypothetical protein PHH59_07690 [Methylovulum sp.]|uniref:hypothetical protein n=1 Tax=Methylovulum sp. TaxID=1916980 RepID=UPI00260F8244|nr:hypothetical protein [Methylovulum sp.]MDD2723887.1 hypothetical protein [Methylovulum sp.]MDD5125480.1 hypothetical protein [Methylovulum sp.]